MNSYTIKARLGQGAFSTVYKVLRKQDNLDYAMKKIRILSLSEKQLQNCLNEVRILASVDHPHILSYKDSFFDELTNTFCIVTELVQGGDLTGIIMKNRAMKVLIKEDLIWQVASQILQGLKALHDANILHRDIKSANIFLSKNNQIAKLGDMNVSIISNNGMAKTQTGTPYYASPQVWKQMPYNSKCDIWSLGCVLYEMAALMPPFEAKDLRTLKKNIIAGVYKRIPKTYSDELQKFIRMCLKVKPTDRSSVEELLSTISIKKNYSVKRVQSLQKSSYSVKMIDKIDAPSKREFRIIKTRLPPNRFGDSVPKSQKSLFINNSTVLEKPKEKQNEDQSNIVQVKSNRIFKKSQISILNPTRMRSMSSNSTKQQLPPLNKQNQKSIFQKKQINECPNIPKPKPIRA